MVVTQKPEQKFCQSMSTFSTPFLPPFLDSYHESMIRDQRSPVVHVISTEKVHKKPFEGSSGQTYDTAVSMMIEKNTKRVILSALMVEAALYSGSPTALADGRGRLKSSTEVAAADDSGSVT
jgi:hypothetical protein